MLALFTNNRNIIYGKKLWNFNIYERFIIRTFSSFGILPFVRIYCKIHPFNLLFFMQKALKNTGQTIPTDVFIYAY